MAVSEIFPIFLCKYKKEVYICSPSIFAVQFERRGFRGVAQLASASGLGPEGPVFESQYPDIQKTAINAIQTKKLTDIFSQFFVSTGRT